MNGSLTPNQHELQASKNFIWLSISQILVRIIGVLFYFFLAFKLKEDGLGEYGFISSFVPFWFIFIDFGAGDYLYREWTKKYKSNQQVQDEFNILFTSRLIIAFIIFIPFLLVNLFINKDIIFPLIISFTAIFMSMFVHLYDLYLQSNNLFKYTAIRQIIEKAVTVIIALPLLLFIPKVEIVFLTLLFGYAISLYYYYKKLSLFRIRLRVDIKKSFEYMKKGLPFMFIGLFSSIYSRIDSVMLRFYNDFATVGWYGAAYKFLDISALFSVLFTTSVFPILSDLYNNAREKFYSFSNKSIKIIFSSSILISLFFIIFAPDLIKLFFPESFSPTILTLRILMIAQTLMFISIFFNNLLLIQNKEKKALIIIISGATINVLLNILLIPKYSLYGAAWATVIAEFINVFFIFYFLKFKFENNLLYKTCGILILNIIFLLLMKFSGEMNNLLLGLVLIIINILILFKSKLINWADFTLFMKPIYIKIIQLKK